MDNLIVRILHSAIENMIDEQPDILDNTNKTSMTEWNLSHHLSNYIAKYIFWLDNDNDLTKKRCGRKRPDIILHKRGTNAFNFLVIEVKKNENDDKNDISKIRKKWMGESLKYRYGAYVNIWSVKECERQVLKYEVQVFKYDCPNNNIYNESKVEKISYLKEIKKELYIEKLRGMIKKETPPNDKGENYTEKLDKDIKDMYCSVE